MSEDLYIVHNAFSLLLSISLTTCNPRKSTIIFAHKKSKEIIKSIKNDLNLENIKLVPYSAVIPPSEFIPLKTYENLFLSNPWHKRLIPFYLAIKKARRVHIIDDGFATINENYKLAIQKELGGLEIKILNKLNEKIKIDNHYSIFNKSSEDFSLTHKIRSKILITPRSILDAFKQQPKTEDNSKNIIIILGSTSHQAQEIKKNLTIKNLENLEFRLKDHPNLIGGLDDLGCPPEFFLMRHMESIKKIYHCNSSTAYISNYLFPAIATEEYIHAK